MLRHSERRRLVGASVDPADYHLDTSLAGRSLALNQSHGRGRYLSPHPSENLVDLLLGFLEIVLGFCHRTVSICSCLLGSRQFFLGSRQFLKGSLKITFLN